MEKELTDNCRKVLGAFLVVFASLLEQDKDLKGLFARQVFDTLKDTTFNSVNASLASLASKGYFTKEKAQFGDKLLTCYIPTQKALNYKQETSE